MKADTNHESVIIIAALADDTKAWVMFGNISQEVSLSPLMGKSLVQFFILVQ